MQVIHTIAEFRTWRRSLAAAATTPFVPTMGALHDGHASLIRQARSLAGAPGKVLSSVFVNPTQFGPGEDFSKYPRTLESDVKILAAAGCDALFVPSADEMYPHQSAATTAPVMIDPGSLADSLEGAFRPGHFRGVCTVVAKLLNIVQPTHLLLGQKDYQQQAILRRMCQDLNLPVEVVTCPTVRESDGLAMSSRNRYLNANERPKAPAIYAALTAAQDAFNRGQRRASALQAILKQQITTAGLEVQYAVAAHSDSLTPWADSPQGTIDGPCVLLVAAKLGTTRLLDNLVLA